MCTGDRQIRKQKQNLQHIKFRTQKPTFSKSARPKVQPLTTSTHPDPPNLSFYSKLNVNENVEIDGGTGRSTDEGGGTQVPEPHKLTRFESGWTIWGI